MSSPSACTQPQAQRLPENPMLPQCNPGPPCSLSTGRYPLSGLLLSVFGFLLAVKPQPVSKTVLSPASSRMSSLPSALHRPVASADNWLVLVRLTSLKQYVHPDALLDWEPHPRGSQTLSINARHKQVGHSGWLRCLSWSPGLCLPIVLPPWSQAARTPPLLRWQ